MDPARIQKALVGLSLSLLPLAASLWAVFADHYPRRMDSSGMAQITFDAVYLTPFENLHYIHRPLFNFLVGVPLTLVFGPHYYVVSGIINTVLALIFTVSFFSILKLYLDRITAAFAVAMISMLPAVIFEVVVFENDLALLSFCALFFALILRMIQKTEAPRRRSFVLLGCVGALALFARPVEGTFSLLFLSIPLFWHRHTRSRTWIAILTVFALVLPWFLFFRTGITEWLLQATRRSDVFGHLHLNRLDVFGFLESYVKEFMGLGTLILIGLSLFYRRGFGENYSRFLRKNRAVLTGLLMLALVYPIVLTLLAGVRSPVYFYTSLLAGQAFVFILLSPLVHRSKTAFRILLAGFTVIYIGVALSSTLGHHKIYDWHRDLLRFRVVNLPLLKGDHHQREVAEKVNEILKPERTVRIRLLNAVGEPFQIPWFDQFTLNVVSYDLGLPLRWDRGISYVSTADSAYAIRFVMEKRKERLDYYLIGPRERLKEIIKWVPEEERSFVPRWLREGTIEDGRFITSFQLKDILGGTWTYELYEKTKDE